jgi:hypothetical protein
MSAGDPYGSVRQRFPQDPACSSIRFLPTSRQLHTHATIHRSGSPSPTYPALSRPLVLSGLGVDVPTFKKDSPAIVHCVPLAGIRHPRIGPPSTRGFRSIANPPCYSRSPLSPRVVPCRTPASKSVAVQPHEFPFLAPGGVIPNLHVVVTHLLSVRVYLPFCHHKSILLCPIVG